MQKKSHGMSGHTSSSKKLVQCLTRNQYPQSGCVEENTLFLETNCILLYAVLGFISSSQFTSKVCCVCFMFTLQRNKIGSITKILRTLQLAIFLSSLLRVFFCRATNFLSFSTLCESSLRSRKSEKHTES